MSAAGVDRRDELELFRESVRSFVEREIVPNFERWESQGRVDRGTFATAGAAGFLGIEAPVEFGGGGVRDFRFHSIFIEEFCRAGVLGAGGGLQLHSAVVIPYFRDLGTDDQRSRWLPGLCAGTSIAAIAITEPDAGSDVAALRTRARSDGDKLVLNGTKQFITNGHNSDLIVVVCKTDGADRHRDMSLVVVEGDTPGLERSAPLAKIGQHCSDTAVLTFNDVVVPRANMLGEPNQAFGYLVERLPQERLVIAATAVAHAETAFDWTLEYCKSRKAFGQAIGSFQNSRFVLAGMRTELDIARVFVDHLTQLSNDRTLSAEMAAEAKWWCTELNKRVLDTCLQLHGGYGYMEEYPIARAWRDGRAMSIYGGTTEIMKDIIGRRTLGL